jgi:hypothetical protein
MVAQFKLIKSETKPLNEDLLTEFSSLPGGPTERLFKEARVAHLRNKILNGNAIPFIWAIAEMNGQKIRVNGLHSSTMLKNLDGERPEDLTVHLDTYHVDDKQGLVRLFRQFDDRKSGRDAADVAGAFQMLEDPLVPLDRIVAKRAVEGIAWFDWNVEGVKTLLGDDRYMLFHETAIHPFLIWCDGIYDLKTKELEEVPISAAMWATWKKSKEAAEEFWKLVAHGGPTNEDNHPATKLDEWLKMAKDKKKQELSKKPKPGEFFNGCIYAWNAYRKGDATLGKIKSDTSKGMFDALE